MKKVLLHDIVGQIAQKLGFIMRRRPSWRPSWMSRLAEGYKLDIRLICHSRGPNDAKSTINNCIIPSRV